ncbi:oxygen-insensitive NAD(P)H nitroreductase [Xanthomonas citri]|uniref:oxygen-insensitive NAD(P)H nitroreductase n=1 Tax=Xanthomonas citri TaxID=346 RepID=UPI001EEDDCCC|nr:oxygen-insensitive NAD(P)H nitroreductase [Xanthomonas citri]
MNIVSHAKRRHSTKAFDPTRKVPAEVIAELRELIRLSPSSVNSQPWHFVVASSDDAKARVAKAAQGRFTYNEPKILNASHVFVLCARNAVDDSHLSALLSQEDQDGRFINPDARSAQRNSRQSYVDLHRYDLKDAQHWIEKQVYLALGTLLLGAATFGVDACPMEDSTQRRSMRNSGCAREASPASCFSASVMAVMGISTRPCRNLGCRLMSCSRTSDSHTGPCIMHPRRPKSFSTNY